MSSNGSPGPGTSDDPAVVLEVLRRELAAERGARREAEAGQHRLAFLYQATATLLAAESDRHRTLEALAQIAVPDLADWCLVDRVDDEGGEPVRIAVAHLDPAKADLAASLAARSPVAGDPALGVPRVLATGEPELVPELPRQLTESSMTGHLALLREVGARSSIIVPLVVAGRTIGAVTFIAAESGRRYGPADLALAVDLCGRVSLLVGMAALLQAERTARAAAESAIQSRDDLLAVVSHDLRNPLTTMVAGASLVEMNAGGNEPVVKAARAILRAASSMDHLIGDLLDLARIQTGQLVVDRQPCDIESIVADTVESLGPLAAARQQTLIASTVAVGRPIPCDRERVIQVLSNLVGNAVKFGPVGQTVVLSAELDPTGVRLSVADRGPGIPLADLPHVFERYWQARKTARLGVGLGLSIARGIVAAHGGRIWVESQPDHGSTFLFTLPAV